MARIQADGAVFCPETGEVVTPEHGVGGGRFTVLGVALCAPEVCATCVSTTVWLLDVISYY